MRSRHVVTRDEVRQHGRVRTTGRFDTALAWYFVVVWGSGFLATKTGLIYTAPFTFLSLRYLFGVACLVPLVLVTRAAWPSSRRELIHVAVAGLLMHAINLTGSHHAQYFGMSAGITALILALQPLLTALVSHRMMGDPLGRRQWIGVVIGLLGVGLVVWHKVNIRAVSAASLGAVALSLVSITAGTLYQRAFCSRVDLRSSALIQFVASAIVVVPAAWLSEGFAIRWSWQLVTSVVFLVVFASILGVNAFHGLMRRGHATKVTSLLYLTPIIAVLLEWIMFRVVPTPTSVVGIAVTTAGVALVSWQRRAKMPPGERA
jgi:drug/metabolite transporter (DMT)-like permease